MTREEAINMLNGMRADNLNFDDLYTRDKYEALDVAIKALDQEPCEDAISREEVLKLFATHAGKYLYYAIKELPPVQPKTRVGHWEIFEDCSNEGIYCSVCHKKIHRLDFIFMRKANLKYCPNCGVKIIEKVRKEKE